MGMYIMVCIHIAIWTRMELWSIFGPQLGQFFPAGDIWQ